MRRTAVLFAAPTLLVLAISVLPLILGDDTLYFRDVLNVHYPLKSAQAHFLTRGQLPLVDPFRGGGQPLVGNLNAVPLYPDNLLYLIADPLWALNAHFWLHWLLAPVAAYWLSRAWGLGRQASWAGGACYAASGYFLSQLNLYNLVAGATLIPAFTAATLQAWGSRRGGYPAAAALLWALLLLSGDPLMAFLALVLAAGAGPLRHRLRPQAPAKLVAALLLGTAAAAPQVVALLQILPLSFRQVWGYSVEQALVQSWDPRSVLEWVVPLFHGLPDYSFWGRELFGGHEPLFYSLYPGLLACGLVVVSGRSHRACRWAWSMAALGGFLALGAANPLLVFAVRALGSSLLRYPVKAWPLVAVACSVLCAVGYERLCAGGRRRLAAFLVAAAALYGCGWLLLTLRQDAAVELVSGVWPEGLPTALIDLESRRWSRSLLACLALSALLGGALRIHRVRPELGGALLLAVHVAGQCFLLRPLFVGDEAAAYRQRPPALEALETEGTVVHGGVYDVFGRLRLPVERFPDYGAQWSVRLHLRELHPLAGIPWGVRYELNPSAEGLDAFGTVALARAMRQLEDTARLRLLGTLGVETLLIARALDPAAEELVDLRAELPSLGRRLRVYRLRQVAPRVALAGTVHQAPDLSTALEHLTDPAFDPGAMVVRRGDGPVVKGSRGRARLVEETVESLTVTTSSEEAAVLVTQRSHLPIYRASVDGREVEPLLVNFQRLAVEVPAGSHRVRLWVDRRPFRAAVGLAIGALIAIAVLAASSRRGAR